MSRSRKPHGERTWRDAAQVFEVSMWRENTSIVHRRSAIVVSRAARQLPQLRELQKH